MPYDRLHSALDRALRSKKAWDTRRGAPKAKAKGKASDGDEAYDRLHRTLDHILDSQPKTIAPGTYSE
jgi:hypothetical protein